MFINKIICSQLLKDIIKAFSRKMLRNPAGERNKQPILEILQKYIDTQQTYKFLEISSGCGLHSAYIAKVFPNVIFQPSEFDVEMFQSIKEYTKNLGNVHEPIFIDISQPLESWDSKCQDHYLRDCVDSFDFMLNINMMHITPFECSVGLFNNSSALLKQNGMLFTYGPYSVNNVLTPESNVSFNASLKQRNASWGIRDVVDLKKLAENNSMELLESYDLPANNKMLVWRKN